MIVPQIKVLDDSDYSRQAAQQLGEAIVAALEQRGRCRLGLAGGSTPGPVYQHLALPPWAARIRWDRVDLFWGDERCVPPSDARSNFRMVQETLIQPAAIPPDNVHRIAGEAFPADAADRYEAVLAAEPLDLLLLGMGHDGHTASLFPETAELGERRRRVVPTVSPSAPHQRISLTLRAINESRLVCLLVTGADKAARLAEVLRQLELGRPQLPAALVQPESEQLVWLLDQSAAAEL